MEGWPQLQHIPYSDYIPGNYSSDALAKLDATIVSGDGIVPYLRHLNPITFVKH